MPANDKKASWLVWGATWLILLGLWMLFVAKLDWQEFYAGLAAAAVGTLATWVFEVLGLVKCRPKLQHVAEAWRLPWYLITGTIEIGHGLLLQLFSPKGAPSFLGAVAFDVGENDPVSAGRRALAITYTTMTPNFVVLGLVREQGLMLYHQILPGEVLALTRKLGARP